MLLGSVGRALNSFSRLNLGSISSCRVSAWMLGSLKSIVTGGTEGVRPYTPWSSMGTCGVWGKGLAAAPCRVPCKFPCRFPCRFPCSPPCRSIMGLRLVMAEGSPPLLPNCMLWWRKPSPHRFREPCMREKYTAKIFVYKLLNSFNKCLYAWIIPLSYFWNW